MASPGLLSGSRSRNLRRRGYEIEASTKKGYHLTYKPDLLDADVIRSGLKTKWLGKDLRIFSEVNSTNEIAKSMASGSPNGTVILAETQTQGRGRLSRPWASPPGGVWMSLILKPEMPLASVYQINMAVSVAVSKAIFSLLGLKAGIKWPNDLLIRERKICGILMEISAEVGRLDYAVVGLGINANVGLSRFSGGVEVHFPFSRAGPRGVPQRIDPEDSPGDRRGIRKDGIERDI